MIPILLILLANFPHCFGEAFLSLAKQCIKISEWFSEMSIGLQEKAFRIAENNK